MLFLYNRKERRNFMFIDRAVIEVRSGKGGDGAIAFLHEKYVAKYVFNVVTHYLSIISEHLIFKTHP